MGSVSWVGRSGSGVWIVSRENIVDCGHACSG